MSKMFLFKTQPWNIFVQLILKEIVSGIWTRNPPNSRWFNISFKKMTLFLQDHPESYLFHHSLNRISPDIINQRQQIKLPTLVRLPYSFNRSIMMLSQERLSNVSHKTSNSASKKALHVHCHQEVLNTHFP